MIGRASRGTPVLGMVLAAVVAVAPLQRAAAGSGSPDSSATKPDDRLARYRERRLRIRLRTGIFQPPYELRRGDEKVDLGFAGGRLERTFAGVPEAVAHARSFRRRKISGTVLATVGAAGLAVSSLILGLNPDLGVRGENTDDPEISPTFWLMLLSPAAVTMTGGFVQRSAAPKLSEAVDAYNRDLRERLRRRSAGPDGDAGLRLGWRWRF